MNEPLRPVICLLARPAFRRVEPTLIKHQQQTKAMSHAQIVTQNIRHRRTIKPKAFTNQPIDSSLISEILENANWAPTHGLTEPWRFVVFTGDSRKELAELLAATYKEITPPDAFKPNKYESYGTNPMRAPVVIGIGLKRQASEKIPEIEEVEAVACAVQNMHLTAAAHGLGGFWSSNAAAVSDQMKQYLGFEDRDRILGLFYLGYPEGSWPAGERTPIGDKVVWR